MMVMMMVMMMIMMIMMMILILSVVSLMINDDNESINLFYTKIETRDKKNGFNGPNG